jgi:ssDNA-binding Zn-finger/Zn-ribbon topoisomerase 1
MNPNEELKEYWLALREKPDQLAEEKKTLLTEGICEACGEPLYKIGRHAEHRLLTCLNPECSCFAEVGWVY